MLHLRVCFAHFIHQVECGVQILVCLVWQTAHPRGIRFNLRCPLAQVLHRLQNLLMRDIFANKLLKLNGTSFATEIELNATSFLKQPKESLVISGEVIEPAVCPPSHFYSSAQHAPADFL